MSLQFSIVIPVWNGAAVIAQCLETIDLLKNDRPLEIICVDNDSRDESASIIAARFPHVQLLRQPVNLGFAGGINVGIQAARGEAVVMLNQDCLPQAGWLSALATAFTAQPQFGIAGCTIYFADGRLDHAGAYMTRPSALGEHLTEVGREPRVVDFVTGAAMAIQHAVFDQIGLFDEGFYPAYYEECDFCYRAREHDFETAYVPAARITHLRSSREAQTDPIKLFGNHQRARYRFIIKQFNPKEIGEFIAFEIAAIESEVEFTHAVARIFGARDTLRALPDIVERRRRDRNDELSPAVRRQLEVGFTTILRRAFARAESLGAPSSDQAREKLSSRLITQLSNWTRRSTLTNPDREIDQLKQQLLDMREGFERRLRLLEILTDYDYR